MKINWTLILALLIGAVLLLYAVTYRVRFDQTAVVTTFGRAGKGDIHNADPEKDQSGFYWKWPYPINVVKSYDKRVQVLEDRPEEQQTLDSNAIVVQTYLAWRITDPLEFHRALGSVEEGEKQLRSLMRDARKIIGDRYNFEDLTNTDPKKLKLEALEKELLVSLKEKLQTAKQPYGIDLVSVGIKRIVLAPKTTEEVFGRMKATRQRMAQDAISAGDAEAKSIKSEAESLSKTILSFAERRSRDIRAEGDRAASELVNVFEKDQNFAVFLRQLEALQMIFSDSSKGKATFLIDAKTNDLFKGFQPAPPAGK